MRFGPKDIFWVVVDPTKESGMSDCLFETTLEGLYNQFRGGLTMESRPTIFTEKTEAEVEAFGRLTAMRAAQAISRMEPGTRFQQATRIQVLGPDGAVLFDADL
jgi:hypothetical protein